MFSRFVHNNWECYKILSNLYIAAKVIIEIIWSELTPIIFNMELTRLSLEATIHCTIKKIHKLISQCITVK